MPAIGDEAALGAGDVDVDADRRSDRVRQKLAQVRDQGGRLDRLRTQLVTPSEGQQTAADGAAPLDRILDETRLASDALRVLGMSADVRRAAADDLQDVVEIVRDPASELPERRHSLGVCGLLLRHFARGHLPSDLRLGQEAVDEQGRGPVQRHHDHGDVACQEPEDPEVDRRAYLQQRNDDAEGHHRDVGHSRQRDGGQDEAASAHHPGAQAPDEELHFQRRSRKGEGRDQAPHGAEGRAVEDHPSNGSARDGPMAVASPGPGAHEPRRHPEDQRGPEPKLKPQLPDRGERGQRDRRIEAAGGHDQGRHAQDRIDLRGSYLVGDVRIGRNQIKRNRERPWKPVRPGVQGEPGPSRQ